MPCKPTTATVALPRSDNAELEELIAEYGRYVTYPQAAEITTASVRTLKRMTQRGELPCYRIGRTRTLRVKTRDVFKLIERVA